NNGQPLITASTSYEAGPNLSATQLETIGTPCTAAAVTTQPTNQSITYGQNAAFTAAASGNPTPTVQWQVDTGSGFTNISSATSSPANTDSISACTLAQGANPVGTVSCQVSVTPTTPFAVHTINASFTATDSVHANSSTTTGAALTVSNPDTKPPVVTITFSAVDGQNGWYVHSPVLGTV